ncbi:hypothetical protein [Oligoflexus tunisiensis]|uniref:hypothetical protein n=1 Tax=Oligoflexus tunisiensis TaxID=708132 RepID=UPI00114CF2AC|nr:hypothetical protein [Oligoflexus tunisiensis]
MTVSIYSLPWVPVIFLSLFACGKDDIKQQSLQERLEAVYGFTDCKEAIIGTALTQQTWITVFHTYFGGYLRQTETTFLDEKCKSSYTSLNRWAEYSILNSSNEETGEIHLEMKTRRILSYTNENAPSELPGIPHVSCNIEMVDDLEKEECKPYFGTRRYVTLNLAAEGLLPFKDIDSAGTTEEARSTELAPYTLSVLDPIDK